MFTIENKESKFYLPLNLQLFAEKSATVDSVTFTIDDEKDAGEFDDDFVQDDDDALDDIEVEDSDDDADDTDGDSDASDDTDGREGAEDNSDGGDADSDGDKGAGDGKEDSKSGKEDAKKENPVAKAVIAERKRLQAQMEELRKKAAATEKLMQLVGVSDMSEFQQRLDAAEAARIAKQTGVTPEQAAEQIRQRRELEEQRREIRRLKYSQEAERLKKDPFFADIEDYREEFEEIAERTGQTLEEVYMAKRGRQRMKEYEREVEQRTLANKEKRQKSKVDTSQNGEQIKREKVDLTPDQLAMAKTAVKMGIFESVAEYAKYLKKK